MSNNPILYSDHLGDTVKVQGSDEFKANYQAAANYLKENGAGELLAQLEGMEAVITVVEVEGGSYYSLKTNTIGWDSDMGVLTDELVELSPASVLNHEAAHAVRGNTEPDKMMEDKKKEDPDYGNAEEKRVITGPEQETALKLKEITPGQVTRKNHNGSLYPTAGPTTTNSKYYITPDDDKK